MAFNSEGVARSGMGIDAGDFDGDGNPDFVVTNFHDEFHALYRNGGGFPYRELSRSSGLTRFTVPSVGWGVRFIDYDNRRRPGPDHRQRSRHPNHRVRPQRHHLPAAAPAVGQ